MQFYSYGHPCPSPPPPISPQVVHSLYSHLHQQINQHSVSNNLFLCAFKSLMLPKYLLCTQVHFLGKQGEEQVHMPQGDLPVEHHLPLSVCPTRPGVTSRAGWHIQRADICLGQCHGRSCFTAKQLLIKIPFKLL